MPPTEALVHPSTPDGASTVCWNPSFRDKSSFRTEGKNRCYGVSRIKKRAEKVGELDPLRAGLQLFSPEARPSHCKRKMNLRVAHDSSISTTVTTRCRGVQFRDAPAGGRRAGQFEVARQPTVVRTVPIDFDQTKRATQPKA